MAQRHEFGSYHEYLKSQRQLTLRKIKKKTRGLVQQGVDAVINAHSETVDFGICHGVRFSHEIDLLEAGLGGRWIGTEIVEELCDENRIYCQDFSIPRKEWIGAADVVYSNALDHSISPEKTLEVWLDQLTPEGRLYVEWSRWHNKLGRRGNKADCFAASLDEYRSLLSGLGEIEAVLEAPNSKRVFQIRKAT